MNTPERLFTIAQAANACGVSRSTLLRMEDEGLLTPALHEEGKYRYYSAVNVMQAMQIYAMHSMGLTHREIRPLVDTPEELGSVIEQLETMRNNLDHVITNLKKRTLQDSSTVMGLLNHPETLCYIRSYDVEGSRFDLGQYLMETFSEAIREGCRFDWNKPPFIRVCRPDLAKGTFQPGLYKYHICVPIVSHPKGCRDISTVLQRRVLSVTWHGRVTDLPNRTLTLAAEARSRGLKPTGWFHAILMLLNTPPRDMGKQSQVLQLGCIVE